MKISDCLELVEVKIPIGKGHICAKASQGLLTIDMYEQFQKVEGETFDLPFAAEMLSTVLHSWDLKEDDGSVVPITAERLRSLPVAVMLPCMTAVFETLNPTSEEAAT